MNLACLEVHIAILKKTKKSDIGVPDFLSSETIDGALTEFVKALRTQGYLVVDKTRQGVRRILLGPGRR